MRIYKENSVYEIEESSYYESDEMNRVFEMLNSIAKIRKNMYLRKNN